MKNVEIKTKCFSYHKYNERERVDYFLQELNSGKKIALVSDAGTPMICDPGSVVVSELTQRGYSITALPGACAVTTFLSEIPRFGEEFSFIGFIPRSEKQIEDISKKYMNNNFVFYDSPERILKTLKVLMNVRGNVKIALGRELSKLFEEIVVDNISNILDHFKDGIKGEIVCMVYAAEDSNDADMESKIRELKSKNFKDKEISIILSTICGFNKNEVYKKSLSLD